MPSLTWTTVRYLFPSYLICSDGLFFKKCGETGVVKVGVDRTRGGAIGFFGPSGSDHNMINCHDMGREVTNAVHTLCFHDISNLQPNATGPAFLLRGSGVLQP